ncbi:hypothetical protein NUU61_006468 [Penicillium alfredii]|uniref:F-box domain-containing protein n=1 Tax=Penicillium alfredii TaxID=1506179 RepID=A0A9W9F0W3_9EURO|nr:uncharacterized protein NUU61_006468 [Penicillium alfredii]KAJ5091598.1 hypothetical protein NUU61_006468 [Penicillium alfredii]
MSTPLIGLPPELLRLIAGNLSEDHPPSLSSFARANRRCYSAAAPFLFHTGHITTHRSQDLHQSVEKYSQKLQRNASTDYVRCLVIDGELTDCDPKDVDPVSLPHIARPQGLRATLDSPISLHGSLDEYDDAAGVAVSQTPEQIAKTNPAWQPVADLIQQLPLLSDLIFACHTQFPPCLLDALHEHRPTCRLHLNAFGLRSLNSYTTGPYEFQLVTSPSLYSIRVHYVDEDDDHHPDAVRRIVAALAPNLREVIMNRMLGGARIGASAAETPWPGFTQDTAFARERNLDHPPRGALRCLRLFDWMLLSRDVLEQWESCTDFCVLQVLKLETIVKKDALEYLATEVPAPFATPPPLSSLHLKGWHPDLSIASIVEHHGPHLHELSLTPCPGTSLTQSDLNHLASDCPRLQKLSITLRRSLGDVAEVSRYKTLGSTPHLQHISLALDASDQTVSAESAAAMDADDEPLPLPNRSAFDAFDHQICEIDVGSYCEPRNGHIRETLVNAALDGELARSTFRAIASGKHQRSVSSAASGSASWPLQTLSVRITGAGEFGDEHQPRPFHRVLWGLTRPWRVERNPRDDCDDLLVLPVPSSPHWMSAPAVLPKDLVPVWRRVWSLPDAGKWGDSWHALPLAEV